MVGVSASSGNEATASDKRTCGSCSFDLFSFPPRASLRTLRTSLDLGPALWWFRNFGFLFRLEPLPRFHTLAAAAARRLRVVFFPKHAARIAMPLGDRTPRPFALQNSLGNRRHVERFRPGRNLGGSASFPFSAASVHPLSHRSYLCIRTDTCTCSRNRRFFKLASARDAPPILLALRLYGHGYQIEVARGATADALFAKSLGGPAR